VGWLAGCSIEAIEAAESDICGGRSHGRTWDRGDRSNGAQGGGINFSPDAASRVDGAVGGQADTAAGWAFSLGKGKGGGGSSKQARVKVKLGNITDSYVYSTSEVGTQRQLMHPLLSCRWILTAPALHWQVWAGRQPSCRDVGRETNAVVVVVVVASSTAMQRHVWQPWPSASQVMTWPAVHWQRGVECSSAQRLLGSAALPK